MWSWLSFAVGAVSGLVVGGFIGVVIMCIVSCSQYDRFEDDKDDKDDKDN